MKIGVAGGSGRMGRMLIAAVLDTPAASLAAVSDRPDSAAVGLDVGALVGQSEPLGLLVGGDAVAFTAAADCVIDFTTPAATAAQAQRCAEQGKSLVVGTTGLEAEHHDALAAAARSVPVVVAANFSLGVALLAALVEKTAALLGPEFDIEVLEMHHRHKQDAPSGTALALGAAAARGRGVDLRDAAVRTRDGWTGPRPDGAIGFATLRGGDVVGDHTVMFAGLGERIELTHKASSREIFSRGAVKAALWTKGRAPGLYGINDVLGL